MTWAAASQIDHVDRTLGHLSEYRHRCDDPGELLRIVEAIDRRLDERLVLMRRVEQQEHLTAGDR
ncbi:hypothetical protein [Jiangella asiatica]|uniref:Uncharacterized protein n=1 Tax=Jiangella asiatica TaxID=2530372 RepID=A0A4R5DDK4_9ACTN|nr:hypothetical protein [Jiangella asiatica]TDE08353.1 hypothetical protein E1269_17770 [Jiangella asiatica]